MHASAITHATALANASTMHTVRTPPHTQVWAVRGQNWYPPCRFTACRLTSCSVCQKFVSACCLHENRGGELTHYMGDCLLKAPKQHTHYCKITEPNDVASKLEYNNKPGHVRMCCSPPRLSNLAVPWSTIGFSGLLTCPLVSVLSMTRGRGDAVMGNGSAPSGAPWGYKPQMFNAPTFSVLLTPGLWETMQLTATNASRCNYMD